MEQFTLDFDMDGKGYIVVVTPQTMPNGTIYNARLEDLDIRFLPAEDGSLLPVSTTGADPRLLNAIATRILERVNARNRGKDMESIP